jgi:hypothetical protein
MEGVTTMPNIEMKTEEQYTVAILEKETDRLVGYNEKLKYHSSFDAATDELADYVDTIHQAKPRGTKEHFAVFVLPNNDNPIRFEFEVIYEPKPWKKTFQGAPMFNESGTNPYQFSWTIPEDVDTFPTNNFTPDGQRIFLDNFPQTRRFSTYEAINRTFENRIRVRLNRQLGWKEPTGFPADDEDPGWDPIDYVTRMAKTNNSEAVVKQAVEDALDNGRGASRISFKDIINNLTTVCSKEISILRTIYEMENQKAPCSDIVTKAKEMLQAYDLSAARLKE